MELENSQPELPYNDFMVKILLLPPFNYILNRDEILIPWQKGMTYSELLKETAIIFPVLHQHLFTAEGQVRPLIVAGGMLVKPNSAVQPEQEVTLVIPMAGG